MKKIRNMRKRQGFTLVELLIVIIIIGILAGSMMLVAGSGTDRAEATKIISDLRSLKAAALMYYADNLKWPEHSDLTGGSFDKYMDRAISSGDFKIAKGAGTISGDFIGRLKIPANVMRALKGTAVQAGLYGGDDSGPKNKPEAFPTSEGSAWMIIAK